MERRNGFGGVDGRSVSRRQFLGRGGRLLGGLAVAPALLAACGGEDSARADEPQPVTTGVTGTVRISNWPYYIDTGDDGTPQTGSTIDGFQRASGYAVEYREDVLANTDWVNERSAALANGTDPGADIVVVTGWMVKRLADQGALRPVDRTRVLHAANLAPSLASPSYDPDRTYSLPWCSGMAGLAYDPERVGRSISSVEELFNEEFAGRVSLLSEMRDTFGLVMLGLGVDPGACDVADARLVADKIAAAQRQGQFRAIAGNDYTADLVAGDVLVCMAWSGDIGAVRRENPNLRFVVPSEGAMLYTDNMVVPRGAVEIDGAFAWMDYVYDPVNSARIFARVPYMPPVEGARDALEAIDPGLAINPVMFPPVDIQARLHQFRDLSAEDEGQFEALFAELLEG